MGTSDSGHQHPALQFLLFHFKCTFITSWGSFVTFIMFAIMHGGGHFNIDATAHCAIRVMKLHTLSPILSLQYLVMWVSTTDCLTIRLIEHGQLNVAARMLPKISLFPGPCTQYRLHKWPGMH